MLESTLNGNSADILAHNIDTLRQLFPEVICEDKVDFDKLRQILGDYADDTPERYNFTWNGKGRALRLAQSPSTGTLRPCKEESKDWDATQNLYIEGDNLEVLKLLQKAYHGKVKMIYIDPPYNTGGDFVYPDDYADNLEHYKRVTGQVDDGGNWFSTNKDTSGRYHTDWLNMMYPRLRLARNLLRDDGVIFISEDDHEVHNLRKICDEIYGEENFVCTFVWQKRYSAPPDTKDVGYVHESLLMYKKGTAFAMGILPFSDDQVARYQNPDNDVRGVWKSMDYTCRYTKDERPNLYYPIVNPTTGEEVWPKEARVWAMSKDVHEVNARENRIWWGADGTNKVPALKNFISEIMQGRMPWSLLLHAEVGHTDEATKELRAILPNLKFTPKPTRLIAHLSKIANVCHNDIIFDFFSGSATTAHAAMRLNAEDGGNRKFIMVQLQEPCDENSEAFKAGYANICEIGKERIRRAGDKIKAELASKQNGQQTFDSDGQAPIDPEKLDIGFKVFKLDSSNLKKWQPDRDNLEESFYNMVGNYVEDRTELDVVYEIMLKYGIDLTLPLEEYTFDGKKVYSIGFGALVICLDDAITTDVATAIAGLKDELTPETMRVVMKDNGFADDSVKTNVKETLRNAGIDEFVTV